MRAFVEAAVRLARPVLELGVFLPLPLSSEAVSSAPLENICTRARREIKAGKEGVCGFAGWGGGGLRG